MSRGVLAGIIAVVVLCVYPNAAFGSACTLSGTVATWNVSGNGNWSNSSDWSPVGVPNGQTTNVCITNGTSTVNLDINASIENLQVGSGNTLNFNGNTQLGVYGTQIVNAGQINVNGGGGTNTYMFVDHSMTLSGAGTLTLSTTTSGGGNTSLYANNGAATLTNQSTIQGDGTIGAGTAMALSNSGTIDANSLGGTLNTVLLINPAAAVTNTGLLEATNKGVLQLYGLTINNLGGNITANGGTATVELLGNTVVQGGTLNTLSGGTLGSFGTVTLDGSTHGSLTLSSGSTYTGEGNTETLVLGTINNAGNIQLNGGGGTNTYFLLNANTTLQGGGTVTLTTTTSGGGNTNIYENVSGLTLTNVNDIIQGEGALGAGTGLALVNQSSGIINANSTSGPLNTVLQLDLPGGVTNAGLMEASNSGTLEISGTTVNNAGGNIKANSGAVVQLDTSTVIQGGTLTNNGGTMQSVGTVTLDGSTAAGAVTLSGTYTGSGNSQTHILGTINNDKNFQLNGGGGTNTYLFLQGSTTLQGGGTVTLSTPTSGGGNSYFYSNAGAVTLSNVNNTIQGEGLLGDGTAMTVLNQAGGIVNANSTGGTLNTVLQLDTAGGVTNTGLLEASNVGVLEITGTVVNNAGGNITANSGALVQLDGGTTIQGGNLNNVGGTMQTVGTATLDGSTHGALTLNGTYTGSGNSGTSVLGTINNNNNLLVSGGGGTNTYLLLVGNTTLQGGGTVTLSEPASGGGNAFFYSNGGALTLTNASTIQGEGLLGDGTQLTLVNQSGGTINANSTGGPLLTSLVVQAAGSGGSPGVVNQGLMEATNSGVLLLQSATFNNAGGNITANGSTAVVELNGATIQGGTLNTLNSGTFETVSTGTLDGSTQGALTLSHGSTFTGAGNSQTAIFGTFNNNGNILLNGGGGTNTYLFVNGNTTLESGGTVTLSNTVSGGGNAYLYANNGAATLTNVNNTIQGDGIIGQGTALTVVNEAKGIINANSSGAPLATTLLFNPGVTASNLGLMEATNSGVLLIQSTTINNSGGNITANGSKAVVEINSATIQGGTLNTLSGGTFENVSSGTTLDGSTKGAITVNGTFTGAGNSQTIVLGTFNNNGNIQLNGGGGTNTYMFVNGNTTLQGNGKGLVTLNTTVSGGGSTYLYANAGAATLTNVNDTIEGAGVIGNGTAMTLVNKPGGTILANLSGQTLLLDGTAPMTNDGTIKVNAGSAMHVETGAFTNFTGSTLTGGSYVVAGTLEIDELGNAGGEIVNDAANITLGSPSASFIDAGGKSVLTNLNTIASGGAFTLSGSANFTTARNFTNNGILAIGAGSKFDVNGNLTNFSGTTLTGGTYNVTGTLQFNGANIVTNAANIALNGTSSALVNQTGGNGLANFATNAASGIFALAGGRNLTTAGNFTNHGTLNVGSGSKFDVNGNLTNFSGTTLTGGTYNVTGTLQFNGANIVTNAANITLTGTTSKIVNQTGTTSGLANFATNAAAGSFTLASSGAFSTAGNFSNAGTIKVSKGSTFTVASTHSYTQTAGATTDDGTMAASSGGAFSFNGGSVFGNGGTFAGNVTSGGTFNIGDTVKTAGKLAITGTYVQTPAGALNIDVGGKTPGTLFDELNVSGAATLGGTLNLDLINKFTPTIGETFDIMNFASEGGNFSTINGMQINSNEHFTVQYNATNVTLDVVAGPIVGAGNFSSGASPTPEPSSLLLLGSGMLAGVVAYRRKLRTP